MLRRSFDLIVGSLFTLFCVALFTFLLMKCVPGGPFDSDKRLPPEILRQLEIKFHLDLPWHSQFYHYIKDIVLDFNFGPSIKYIGRSVQEIIRESLGVSLELGFYALIIATVFGILLGILSAAFRGTWVDTSLMFVAISGVSLPSFLVAAIAILVFSQWLGWFPAALWDGPENRVLPAIVLGLRPAALIARMTRSSVLEVLYLDYVKTAKAKGLSSTKVLGLHVLRNAMIPIVTLLGPLAATILTGSFIIEHVFSIPGLASHFIQAVTNRDYPLVMGVTLLYAAFLIAANLLVDFMYGVLDPRMRAKPKA